MGDWSPVMDPGWLIQPEWALDEERPERPVSVPTGRNLPAFVPYTYRGSDFSLPAEAAEEAPRRYRRPHPRHRTLHDPEWDTAPPWACRPPYWNAEDAL